jgi:O-antigen biosynthesis protein WbqP
MIRFFDIVFSFFGIIILSPVIVLLLLVGLVDTGSPIFLQVRIGIGKKPFNLIKFRSMHINTESVSTHLVNISSITKWGSFLRQSKLDELPQLFNVLKGDMSFVGPRPNLFTQNDLIYERDIRGVYDVLPGITGLAQINKIDMSKPSLMAATDEKMISQHNVLQYFKYIFLTISGKGIGDIVRR